MLIANIITNLLEIRFFVNLVLLYLLSMRSAHFVYSQIYGVFPLIQHCFYTTSFDVHSYTFV